MLFNSIAYVLVFLPTTCFGFFGVAKLGGRRPAQAWLLLCSLTFYSYWNPIYLALLGASISANFGLGKLLARGRGSHHRPLLVAGITANLLALGFFKYANFFVDNLVCPASIRIPQ